MCTKGLEMHIQAVCLRNGHIRNSQPNLGLLGLLVLLEHTDAAKELGYFLFRDALRQARDINLRVWT